MVEVTDWSVGEVNDGNLWKLKLEDVGDPKRKFEEVAYGSTGDGRGKYWGVTNARLWKVINGNMWK